MAVKIIEAPHFEAESKALGATKENIKAAYALVQAALESRIDLVEVEIIRNTSKDKAYRPWIRIKGKLSMIRVAIERYSEGNDFIVVLHVVLPRDDHTYDEVERLWKQYRSKV
jgi:hypothetical protein